MADLTITKPFVIGPLIGQFMPVFFEVANTEIGIGHSLAIQPQGVIVVFKEKSCDIWDGQMPRTKGSIHLVCDTASVNAVVLILGLKLF